MESPDDGIFTEGLSGKLPQGTNAEDIFISDENHGISTAANGEARLVKRVDTPKFSPAGGTYYTPQTVSISCGTDGATIHYTTDGTDPITASTAYSGSIKVSSTTTVKAIAVKNDRKSSNVASATYTFTPPYVTVNNGTGSGYYESCFCFIKSSKDFR